MLWFKRQSVVTDADLVRENKRLTDLSIIINQHNKDLNWQLEQTRKHHSNDIAKLSEELGEWMKTGQQATMELAVLKSQVDRCFDKDGNPLVVVGRKSPFTREFQLLQSYFLAKYRNTKE